MRKFYLIIGVCGVLLCPAKLLHAAQAPHSELDALMREVLARRDANREALRAFTFAETEAMAIRGQNDIAPLQSYQKRFEWMARDGELVRVPVAVNGVALDAEARLDGEISWLVGGLAEEEGRIGDREFYDWDSLFNFPWEPGRYFYAGREVFEGRAVLRVEYYPQHLFSRIEDGVDSLPQRFDRTTVVTMLVLPEERQIVHWVFESVGLQFLPARILARVSDIEASMTIDSAEDGTWLPRRLRSWVRTSVASAQLTIEIDRRFNRYVHVASGTAAVVSPAAAGMEADTSAVADVASGRPVTQVRVFGNFSVPDGDLLATAGIAAGEVWSAARAAEVEDRLLAAGAVDRVEVRVRSTTLAGDDVAVVIVVGERLAFGHRLMVMPTFEWSDEYGVTVGGLISVVGIYGDDERLSFPLATGGRETAGVEFQDDFQGRFLNGVRTGFVYTNETNPHFEIHEERLSLDGMAFKRWGRLQLDVVGGWADVEFMGEKDQQVSAGFSVRADTRRETGLPRDAVFVEGGYDRLQILEGGPGYNRLHADFRGFIGVFGRSTLAFGFKYDGSGGRLPDYERYLMGGLATLRGFAPGTFIGDNRGLSGAELRVPVWDPLPIVKVGVEGFWDTGAVWDGGTSIGKARFQNGVGAGVFVLAAFLRLKADVAYGFGNGTEFHIGSVFRY